MNKINQLVIIVMIMLQFNTALASTIEIGEYVTTDTAFYNLEGEAQYLDKFEDQTILLVFWASWCGACNQEMALLDNLQKDFRKLPFQVIAVSQDYQGPKIVEKYYQQHNLRHLGIYHDRQNQLFRALNITSLPTALLIDQRGKLQYLYKGVVAWNDQQIRKQIISVIGEDLLLPKNTYKPMQVQQFNQ